MPAAKKNAKTQPVSCDSKKEVVIKQLAEKLQDEGYKVRREKLKQGYGWKVMSGACRHEDNKFIFVDRKLSQDDQIAFLRSKIASFEK